MLDLSIISPHAAPPSTPAPAQAPSPAAAFGSMLKAALGGGSSFAAAAAMPRTEGGDARAGAEPTTVEPTGMVAGGVAEGEAAWAGPATLLPAPPLVVRPEAAHGSGTVARGLPSPESPAWAGPRPAGASGAPAVARSPAAESTPSVPGSGVAAPAARSASLPATTASPAPSEAGSGPAIAPPATLSPAPPAPEAAVVAPGSGSQLPAPVPVQRAPAAPASPRPATASASVPLGGSGQGTAGRDGAPAAVPAQAATPPGRSARAAFEPRAAADGTRLEAAGPMAGDPVPLADAGIEACSVTGEAGRGVAERGSPEPTPASGGARGGPSTVGSQVEVQVARAAQGRIERLVVQLEPADLGRVEIRLEFGQEGRVALSISAERPETLDVLQRDAAALERSLRDAGLRPDAGGLSFGLKRDQGEGAGRGDLAARGAAEPLRTEAEPAGPARGLASLRLLDIRA